MSKGHGTVMRGCLAALATAERLDTHAIAARVYSTNAPSFGELVATRRALNRLTDQHLVCQLDFASWQWGRSRWALFDKAWEIWQAESDWLRGRERGRAWLRRYEAAVDARNARIQDDNT